MAGHRRLGRGRKPPPRSSWSSPQALDAETFKPRRSRAYQERFFPGSTFKVVTATAGLVSGKVTPDNPSYPVQTGYTPPLTNRPIRNFDGDSCGGTLFTILRVSCNSAFAQMGVDVGAEAMIDAAEGFGFNQDVPIDLTSPARSAFPGADHFERNTPALAQSATRRSPRWPRVVRGGSLPIPDTSHGARRALEARIASTTNYYSPNKC